MRKRSGGRGEGATGSAVGSTNEKDCIAYYIHISYYIWREGRGGAAGGRNASAARRLEVNVRPGTADPESDPFFVVWIRKVRTVRTSSR